MSVATAAPLSRVIVSLIAREAKQLKVSVQGGYRIPINPV